MIIILIRVTGINIKYVFFEKDSYFNAVEKFSEEPEKKNCFRCIWALFALFRTKFFFWKICYSWFFAFLELYRSAKFQENLTDSEKIWVQASRRTDRQTNVQTSGNSQDFSKNGFTCV